MDECGNCHPELITEEERKRIEAILDREVKRIEAEQKAEEEAA